MNDSEFIGTIIKISDNNNGKLQSPCWPKNNYRTGSLPTVCFTAYLDDIIEHCLFIVVLYS